MKGNTMITITKEEFLNYSGIDLALELRDLDDDYSKVDTLKNLWAKEYIEKWAYLQARTNGYCMVGLIEDTEDFI